MTYGLKEKKIDRSFYPTLAAGEREVWKVRQIRLDQDFPLVREVWEVWEVRENKESPGGLGSHGIQEIQLVR